jgi:hypothetical protein
LPPAKSIFPAPFVVTGGKCKNKAKSAPVTTEQHQEVEHEEEGGETSEDEKDSTVSPKKEVKDLSTKLNQVFGAVEKLTKQVGAHRSRDQRVVLRHPCRLPSAISGQTVC